MGGSSCADNLRVLCRAHNQLQAEQVFGREVVERSRHFRQKKSTTLEQVRLALRGLGFRDLEVRRALTAIASGHDANEPLALERALRDALFVLTAA
jgi:Holliday junction resolvasome RuvABC DNA-binding subunit